MLQVIQARSNNIGNGNLYVAGPFNPIPGIEEGDLPEIRLDEQTIEKLREAAQWALDIIKKEMKAQRLADSYGPNGWRTVKGILKKNCF